MDKDDVIKILSQNLRAERARKNISQEDLSKIADVSLDTISQIERNRGNPTVFTLVKIAKALEIESLDVIIPLK